MGAPTLMPTFLVAEDCPYVRAMLCDILSAVGQVIEATNGLEAIEALVKFPVSLLITDIVMPELGGLNLARYVRRTRPHVPVVLITGQDIDVPDDFCLIRKPISSVELLLTVQRLLSPSEPV